MSEEPIDFDAMMVALQGETVLPAPRVSRETMIQVLKDHTTLIGGLKSEMTNVSTAVRKLIASADDNKRIVNEVLAKVAENKESMDVIHKTLLEYKIDIDSIKESISCLPEMKDNIQVSLYDAIVI